MSSSIVDTSGQGNTIDLSGVSNNLTINLTSGTGNEVQGASTGTVNWVSNAIDNVIGGSGHDTITGNGSANILVGGLGNDSLVGGGGNDTYASFTGVFGSDTILDSAGASDVLDLTNYASTSVLQWKAKDSNADGMVDNLFINFGGGRNITILNYFNNTSSASGSSGQGTGLIESIQFSDGTKTFSDIQSLTAELNTITGTAGNDSLPGTAAEDSIEGLAGNDTIEGGAGNDTLDGGSGDDVYKFSPGWGSDSIIDSTTFNWGWQGIDFYWGTTPVTANLTINLNAGAGHEVTDGTNTINWASGVVFDWVAGGNGNDLIYGNNNATYFWGNGGNDTLISGTGGSYFDFGAGWGQDSIVATGTFCTNLYGF